MACIAHAEREMNSKRAALEDPEVVGEYLARFATLAPNQGGANARGYSLRALGRTGTKMAEPPRKYSLPMPSKNIRFKAIFKKLIGRCQNITPQSLLTPDGRCPEVFRIANFRIANHGLNHFSQEDNHGSRRGARSEKTQ